MKKLATWVSPLLLWLWLLPQTAWAATLLVPGGQVVGLQIGSGTVTVAAFDDQLGSTSQQAGLKIGDKILEIDGKTIETAEDVRQALERSDGVITMSVERDGKERQLRLTPQITKEGPRLGVYLKQGITGIGTVTWYDPETGEFGTLGHGVNDSSGNLATLLRGQVYQARIVSVKKGQSGQPGQLVGSLDAQSVLGTLNCNTSQGVFGKMEQPWTGEPLPVAEAEDVCTGPATIRSTVSEKGIREYSVEILKIYPKSGPQGRNLLLRVTDPELLEATGGIVQGMSGSPILQNGRIVGAVTHVLVNDPTRGYGIFIENMLEAAGNGVN